MNYVKCKICDGSKDCEFCNYTGKVIDPKEILCNLCGENMCPPEGSWNEQIPLGLYNIEVLGGYDSHYLSDFTKYKFSLCEKCLRNLFIQCKIKPNIFQIDLTKPEYDHFPWEDDNKLFKRREYLKDGGYHQDYLNKICNYNKDCVNAAKYTVLYCGEFSEDAICDICKNNEFATNTTFVPFISNKMRPFL